MFATCHFGCGDRHDGAGNMAVTPARKIAPCRIDGDGLLAGNKAGRDFGLYITDVACAARELGRKAAQELIALVESTSSGGSICIKTDIVERGSLGPARDD